MSFEISKCVDKDLFVSICKEGIELSKIVLAPFGFHDDLQLLYHLAGDGDESNSHDISLLKTSFQQWEEVISRHVFKNCYDINDDQIAASFHQYLEVDKDPKIIELLQSAALCCIRSIEHKNVVDMTLPIAMTKSQSFINHNSNSAIYSKSMKNKQSKQVHQLSDTFNVNDPMITAVILKRLLNALSLIGDGLYELHNVQNHSSVIDKSTDQFKSTLHTSSYLNGIDENIFQFFNLMIPLRTFSIQENFKHIEEQNTANGNNDDVHLSSFKNSIKLKITHGLNLLRQVLTIRLSRQLVPQQQYNHSNHPVSTSHFEYNLIADTNTNTICNSSYENFSISEKSFTQTPVSPASNNTNNDTEYSVSLSVEQYYMLLKLHQFTPEVSAIFEMFQLSKPNQAQQEDVLSMLQMGGGLMSGMSFTSSPPPPPPTIKIDSSSKSQLSNEIYISNSENSIKLCTTTTHALQYFLFHVCYDPSIRYRLQLQELAKSASEIITEDIHLSNNDELDNILDLSQIHLDCTDESSSLKYQRIVYCLTMLSNISELRDMAKSLAEDEGDVEKAVKMLTHAVDKPYQIKDFDDDGDDVEEIDDDEDKEKHKQNKKFNYQKCLNTHLKCLLLVDRATYCQQFLEMSSHEWETECHETKTPMNELIIDSEQVELILQYLTLIYLDCKTAIIFDKFCLKAYSILAKQQLWLSKYLHNLSIVSVKQHPYAIEDYSDGNITFNKSIVKHQNVLFPIYENGKYLFWNIHDDFSFHKTNKKDEIKNEDDDNLEGCSTSNDHYQLVKNYLLHQAVRNSLTAFVVSGCSDVEYATLAEECARESCRDEAKCVYKANHSSEYKEKNENKNNSSVIPRTSTIQPKEWMLQAFYYGHNLLSSAYSIDLIKCLVYDIETETAVSSHIDEQHDTKENEPNQNKIFEFPLVEPPLFLLDSICVEESNKSENNGDDDEDSQPHTTTHRKYVHEGDKRAYKLLKQCVGLIDGMWLDSNDNKVAIETRNNSIKNTLNEKILENRTHIQQAFSSSPLNIAAVATDVEADSDYVLVDKQTVLDVYIGLDNTIESDDYINNFNHKNQESMNYIACVSKDQLPCHRAQNIDDMLTFCSAAQNSNDWLTNSTQSGEIVYEVNKNFVQAFNESNTTDKIYGYLIDYGQLKDCTTSQLEVTATSNASLPLNGMNDNEIDILMVATDKLMKSYSNDLDPTVTTSHVTEVQSAPSSQVFIDVWTLLSTPEACQLTGVTISSPYMTTTDEGKLEHGHGRVVHIEPIESLSGYVNSGKTKGSDIDDDEEEEEEWEDIDDENDDDDDSIKEKDDQSEEKPRIPLAQVLNHPVSYALQARLLNLLSSLLYLSGDALNAIECLRNCLIACKNATILESFIFPKDDLSTMVSQESSHGYWLTHKDSSQIPSSIDNSIEMSTLINDSELKLASLLCDMDETDEAEKLLKSVMRKDGRNHFVLIHMAELYIHQSKFDVALQHLSDAKYFIYHEYDAVKNIRKEKQNDLDNGYNRFKDIFNETISSQITSKKCIKDMYLYKKSIQDQIIVHSHKCAISSIYSLMAAAMFRLHPTEPEHSLNIIKEGLDMHPDSVYMMLCQGIHYLFFNFKFDFSVLRSLSTEYIGEIYSQMGDAMAALQLYKKVSQQVPNNPLPYLNASRVYQQIKLHLESYHHVDSALKIDNLCSMSKVDLAQYFLHTGDLQMSLSTLEDALNLAKHVSEIKDVLTAKIMTKVQIELRNEGFWNANIDN